MPGLNELMACAIRVRRQVLCTYHGATCEVCPITLAQEHGVARALVWQFAGSTETGGEPVRASWKWLELDEMSDVRLRDGPWHAGESEEVSFL